MTWNNISLAWLTSASTDASGSTVSASREPSKGTRIFLSVISKSQKKPERVNRYSSLRSMPSQELQPWS